MQPSSHCHQRVQRRRSRVYFHPQVLALEDRLPPGETLLGLALSAALMDAPGEATFDPGFILWQRHTLPGSNRTLSTTVHYESNSMELTVVSPFSPDEPTVYHDQALFPASTTAPSDPFILADLAATPAGKRTPGQPVAGAGDPPSANLVPVASMAGAGDLADGFQAPASYSLKAPAHSQTPVFATQPPSPVPALTDLGSTNKGQIQENFGRLPVGFEANVGQADPQVQFLAHGPGYSLYLTSSEAVMMLSTKQQSTGGMQHQGAQTKTPTADGQSAAVHMQVLGGKPGIQTVGEQLQPGIVNYFLGNDPTQWHRNIVTYGQVRYPNIYPGIDLAYYGNQQQLEYDFVVAPGADPNQIHLGFSGADQVAVDVQGDLVLHAGGQEIHQHKPVVYQTINGARQEIPSQFVLLDTPSSSLATRHPPPATPQVAFQLAPYDASRPLVIDPVLSYSTYLGGNSADQGQSIAVDTVGNAYLTGFTDSTDFPTANAFQPALGGRENAFVTKIAADGSALLYSSYLGGSGTDTGQGITVDAAGSAFVTGYASSSDFPTVNALQPALGGGADAFVAKLAPDGSALLYSTYLGGSGNDGGSGIAVDGIGNAYVTGYTYSTDFPTANALQPAYGGGGDAFVTKLAPDGSALLYSTYLGGSGADNASAIAVDAGGNAYLTGITYSTDFPTANALQPALRGGSNGFVTKIAADGSSLLYSTYLGGSRFDSAYGIAVDGDGNAYVTGGTNSTDFPIVNAFQPVLIGQYGAFLSKIAADGSALTYSTYFGGSGGTGNGTSGRAVAVDGDGNAYVTGLTGPGAFPLVNAIQSTYGGGDADAFVTKFTADGSDLVYSTYLGGNQWDYAFGIAVDRDHNAYVTGLTESTNFPTINALQALPSGNGIFKSISGGDTWTASNTGLTNGDIRAFAFDPTNPAMIFAGTNGGGVFLSSDAGMNWSAGNAGLTNLSVRALVIDPAMPSILYAGTDGGGIFKSADSGATWNPSNNGLTNLSIRAIVIDPGTPDTLYAATAFGGGVYKSTDGGATWNPSNAGLDGAQVVNLAIDPATPSVLYAGTGRFGVYKSTDGGDSWSPSNAGLPIGYDGRLDIQALAIDPATPTTLYASIHYLASPGHNVYGVYESTNGGDSWTFRSAGLPIPVFALAIDPVTPGTLDAGTDLGGVYKSVDGSSWSPTGLNHGSVFAVAIDPTAPATVFAGAVSYPISAFVAKISP